MPLAAQTVETVGSRALGMGGAFVAVANDSSATWWNPAGLATGPFLDMAIARTATEVDGTGTGDRNSVWSFSLGTPPFGVSYYRLRITDIRPLDPTAEPGANREDRRAEVNGRSPVRRHGSPDACNRRPCRGDRQIRARRGRSARSISTSGSWPWRGPCSSGCGVVRNVREPELRGSAAAAAGAGWRGVRRRSGRHAAADARPRCRPSRLRRGNRRAPRDRARLRMVAVCAPAGSSGAARCSTPPARRRGRLRQAGVSRCGPACMWTDTSCRATPARTAGALRREFRFDGRPANGAFT